MLVAKNQQLIEDAELTERDLKAQVFIVLAVFFDAASYLPHSASEQLHCL
jgi:hypothetical protein